MTVINIIQASLSWKWWTNISKQLQMPASVWKAKKRHQEALHGIFIKDSYRPLVRSLDRDSIAKATLLKSHLSQRSRTRKMERAGCTFEGAKRAGNLNDDFNGIIFYQTEYQAIEDGGSKWKRSSIFERLQTNLNLQEEIWVKGSKIFSFVSIGAWLSSLFFSFNLLSVGLFFLFILSSCFIFGELFLEWISSCAIIDSGLDHPLIPSKTKLYVHTAPSSNYLSLNS